MVSWWASKLACQGGFEDQAQGSEKADLSAQNGRFSRAESVPSPRAESSAADEDSMGDPELSLETSDVSLTYQVPLTPATPAFCPRPGPLPAMIDIAAMPWALATMSRLCVIERQQPAACGDMQMH